MKLTVAYSPCPNDTFMFHDIASGDLCPADWDINCHLEDVETLNRLALDETFDVTKLSFHAYLLVQDRYELLDVGAALGHGCGPLVVAATKLDTDDLAACTFAVPGELTTAHLLLRLWAPQVTNKIFTRYDQVADCIADGRADAGVIIHEGRFTYQQAGLQLLADLGQWWYEQTSLPIPLGCIAAHKRLGSKTIQQFQALLRQAINNSLARPEAALDYVRRCAQGISEEVLRKHIETFVNDYSLDLGDDGRAAVARLNELARQAGVIS